jgi:Sec-independent protein secretion pathway component TatC
MSNEILLSPAMLAIVPLVAYFVQILKGLPYADKLSPYLPIVSMLFGIGGSYAFSIPNPVVAGIMIGMAASTGYNQFRATGTKINNIPPIK